jgi:hypothetical protein
MKRKHGLPLILLPLVSFLAVRFGFDFNGLYGQDAFEYLRFAKSLRALIIDHSSPGDFPWPPGYPLAGAILSMVTVSVPFALQLVSAIGVSVTAWFSLRILKVFHKDDALAASYVLLFLCLSPFMMKAGVLCMSDTACAACISGYFFHAIKYRKLDHARSLLWMFLFGALAFMFRYASVPLLLVPFCWVLPKIKREKHTGYLVAGFLLALIITLPYLALHITDPLAMFSLGTVSEWSFGNYFQSSFDTIDGKHAYAVINVLYVFALPFHPGFFSAGILFLLLLIPGQKLYSTEKMLLLSFVVYALFLAGMPMQSQRFMLPALFLPVLVGYRGYERFARMLNATLKRILFAVVVIVQAGLFAYVLQPYLSRNRLEREIATWITQKTSQQVIYSFDMDVSLSGYAGDREIYNLWVERYDSFAPNSLVLFNPSAFEKQWAGKNPMLNWEEMNRKHRLVKLHDFGKGWELYEIR